MEKTGAVAQVGAAAQGAEVWYVPVQPDQPNSTFMVRQAWIAASLKLGEAWS